MNSVVLTGCAEKLNCIKLDFRTFNTINAIHDLCYTINCNDECKNDK